MIEIANFSGSRGRVVICGGSSPCLCPEVLRQRGDVLVVGELETIVSEFFNDLGGDHQLQNYRQYNVAST
jgi:hypothetical protein